MPDRQFEDMREQAVRRVMEMQRRAQGLTEETNSSNDNTAAHTEKKEQEAPKNAQSGGLSDLIRDLNIDEEKALIALLIYILWKNNADKKLLFALAYLIL